MANLLRVTAKIRNYEIVFSTNASRELKKDKMLKLNKALIITDTNVGPIYLDKLKKELSRVFASVSSFTVEAGGNTKSIQSAQQIYRYLLKKGYTRKDYIIAFGGGVVGDLSGYVAATFYRGMNFVQIPTSLLSQVDSSIGGKVAVHFEGVTNAIGSIYPPVKCIINLNYLKTLPVREISCGLSEIVKMAYIYNRDFFKYLMTLQITDLRNIPNDILNKIVFESIKIKKKVVETDEREAGDRLGLNFGHTLSHALESISGHKELLHGEGVAFGMIFETILSNKLIVGSNKQQIHNLIAVLKKFGLLGTNNSKLVSTAVETNSKEIIELMQKDKKNTDSRVTFVLPVNKGFKLLKLEGKNPIIKKTLKEMVNEANP